MLNKTLNTIALISLLSPAFVHGIEAEDIELSGFMTWGVSKSNNPTPWYVNREITDDVCYDCDTTLGLQLDYEAMESLRFSTQIVKRPEDLWDEPIIEWFYAGYSVTDHFEVRAGKLRLPVFLMSDYYYVGNAYPWIRPVAEVYNRQLGITAFDGIDFIYDWYINDEMTLTFHPYYGTDKKEEVNRIDQQWLFEFEEQYGIALDFTTENLRLHANYFEAEVDLTFHYTPPQDQWSFAGLTGTIPPQPQYILNTGVETFSPSKGIVVANGVTTQFSNGSNSKYRNRAYGISYDLPYGFTVISECQDDDQSLTHYGAVVWRQGKFSPYWIQSKSSSIASRDSAEYSKGERFATNKTDTFGLRYDYSYNVSLNLEYSYSRMLEKAPSDFTSSSPRGQFVVSPWTGTPVPQTPPGPTTTPATNWVQNASDSAHIWSAALNWNF